MSVSENISLWKKKSEIDYITLFIPLWLALNAWMKDKYEDLTKDRDLINRLKSSQTSNLGNKFSRLINADDVFKAQFLELHRSLESANLEYDKLPQNLTNTNNKKISFLNSIAEWNDGSPELISVMKASGQHGKIQISDNLWVTNDTKELFAAYIENLYQIRCLLFHGRLKPNLENEKVVRQLYLTLSMVMQEI